MSGTSGLRIAHWLTFSGPGFVPTSTDEISAIETTAGKLADIGVIPSDLALERPDPLTVPEINFEPTQPDPDAVGEDNYEDVTGP